MTPAQIIRDRQHLYSVRYGIGTRFTIHAVSEFLHRAEDGDDLCVFADCASSVWISDPNDTDDYGAAWAVRVP